MDTEDIPFIGIMIGVMIGFVAGLLVYPIANPQAQPSSSYEGTVEAIYANNPSSITFTSGETWEGNLSSVSNLSVGSICKLIQNASIFAGPYAFVNGTCLTR